MAESNPLSESHTIANLVDSWRNEICQMVNGTEVLNALVPHIISYDDQSILSGYYEQKNYNGNAILLDYLRQTKAGGKWIAFIDALRQNSYSYLASLLTGEYKSPKNNCNYERIIITIFRDYLADKIGCSIVRKLCTREVLTKEDEEKIEREKDRSGSIGAAVLMLKSIQKHLGPHEWYRHFLTVLQDKGFTDLVRNIDPDFISKGDNFDSRELDKGPALPIEILRMDGKAVELYKTALEEGEDVDHSIRIMIIGHFGVGKTTLARRILGETVDIQARDSTNGIDVHICPCKVSLSDLTWHSLQPDEKSDTASQRLAKMIANRSTGEEDAPTPVDEKILKTTAAVGAVGGANQIVDVQGDEIVETQCISKPSDDKEEEEEDKDTACIQEMKKLVAEMTETGTFDTREFASVSLWDFAGQYVFYTTHKMFLSPRAVYLLVTDISKHIGDVVMEDDECCFDSSGPKLCTISGFLDFWLNSIHTCSPDGPDDESTVPPVILVGTHADKLTKATVTDDADFCQREENCNRDKLASDYFEAVRNHLCEKPTRFHLADEDFDIDNTVIDSKLEALKKKIVKVAQRQPHWGKRIPAKWLPLEQALCVLKENGLKIVDFNIIENLNRAMAVPISTAEELELFLQFHHQSLNILYFSNDSLKEKIVLDPQWLVDALKSLITAKKFCLKQPHVIDKWREFDRNGILRPQLLDAVWQKEKNPSFHDNRAHLLALMEQMNLISRPMSWYKDDATPTKEDYHLAPCMLKDKPSESLLSPSHSEDCENTSILVFYFQRKFVHPAIFDHLLAACLRNWSLWRQGKRDLIFCGCGVFKIDQSHKLTLFLRDFTIQAFVTKFGRLEKSPREKVCIAVLEFLDKSLKFVIGCIETSSLYTVCINCPENKSNSVNAMIPVSKLQEEKEVMCSYHDSTDTHVINSVDILKYWSPCKSDIVTAPLTTRQRTCGKAYHSCLSTERLRTKPTEKDLGKISQRIGLDFQLLGFELGLKKAEIEQIRINNSNHIKDVIFNMLWFWEEKVGMNATFSCLEHAMRAIGIDTIEVFEDIDSWDN